MKHARPYVVTYDLKSGIKQRRTPGVMEVDATDAKEAVRIVRDEVQRIFGKHAFGCKARIKSQRPGA